MLGVFIEKDIHKTRYGTSPYVGGTYKSILYGTEPITIKTTVQRIIDNPNNKQNIKEGLIIDLNKLEQPQPPALDALTHLERLKVIFKPMLQASYLSINDANDIARSFGLETDFALSTVNTFVYLDMTTSFPLVVHRGSVDIIYDWLISDVLIATGLSVIFNPRISAAIEIVKAVEAKYNKPSDSFSHSLGGNVAENSGASGYILTYNKAAGLGDVRKKTNPKQIDYRSPKDLVSLLAETQDTTIRYVAEDAGFFNAHGLDVLPEVQQRRL